MVQSLRSSGLQGRGGFAILGDALRSELRPGFEGRVHRHETLEGKSKVHLRGFFDFESKRKSNRNCELFLFFVTMFVLYVRW
jgi:hypothetical protein